MAHIIELCSGRIDLQRSLFAHGGTEVSLTARESALLAYLAERPGQVVSRNQLLREVFETAAGVKSRAVDSTMARLRQKIEPTPNAPVHLRTVVGRGYQFVPLEPPAQEQAITIGRWSFDPEAGTLVGDGSSIALSRQQQRLLTTLGDARGQVVSAERLLLATHGAGGGSRRALTAAMYRLRALVELDPARPIHLRTEPGRGYRLVAHAPRSTPPTPERPLFGREDLVTEAQECLTQGALTLVGEGGIGKTRVALEIAERMPDDTEVCWVELEQVAELPDLRGALASALGVTTDALKSRLDAFTGLLVLDGADRCAEVLSPWLPTHASVVLTARQPLGVPGEQVLELPPLTARAARGLFAHDAGFDPLGPPGGVPLDILLAARLRSPVATPSSGSLASTWQQLSEAARSAWTQATVFVGGFDLHAAEAVIHTPGWVVDALDGLQDAGVVVSERRGSSIRFTLHARVREFGAAKLTETERLTAEVRLLGWARSIARTREVWVGVGDYVHDLPTLRKAHALDPLDPDLTRMLTWPHQQLFGPEAALALCDAALAQGPNAALSIERAGVLLGLMRLQEATDTLASIPDTASPTVRAGVAWLQAQVDQVDLGPAASLLTLERGLAIGPIDPAVRRCLLAMRGDACRSLGRLDEAEALALEALALDVNTAQSRLRLADVALCRGHLHEAIEHLQAALKTPSDPTVRTNAQRLLGEVQWRDGRAEAEQTLTRVVVRAREVGQAYNVAGALAALIRFRVHQRDFGSVPSLAAEALDLVNDTPVTAWAWFHAWAAAASAITGDLPLAYEHAAIYRSWVTPEKAAESFFCVLRCLWEPDLSPAAGPVSLDGDLARALVEEIRGST